jgi:hypothetical protein
MSGNRANSSAVNRRTNAVNVAQPPPQMNRGYMPQQQQMGQQQMGQQRQGPGLRNNPMQQQQQLQQQMPKPKLSVSDAIALITLRLGSVETFINLLPPLEQIGGSLSNENMKEENIRVVDEAVFTSIVTRLERIEQSIKSPNSNSQTQEDTSVLDEKFKNISEEIQSFRSLILSVQSFTIQMNQKIIDIENNYKTILTSKQCEPDNTQSLPIETDSLQKEDNTILENVDLKKFIENEVMDL